MSEVLTNQLASELFEAIRPKTGRELSTLIDALDLFAAYCTRFSGPRDRRFSVLDEAPVDRDAHHAALELRKRVTASFERYFEREDGRALLAMNASDPKKVHEVMKSGNAYAAIFLPLQDDGKERA